MVKNRLVVENGMEVVIDSREQTPLPFKEGKIVTKVTTQKLDVGDYSISGYEHKIAFERKSLLDLYGTLGKGHARFKNELERAKNHDYFAILIIGSFSSTINKDFDGSHHSKMQGHVIIKILYTLKFRYGVDVIFSNGPLEAMRIIKSIFTAYLNENGTGTKKTICSST